jgi:hypothetical protein
MTLTAEQKAIGAVFGYEALTGDEGAEQFPAEVNFSDDPKAVPFNGAVYKNKRGKLRIFWMPQGANYRGDFDDLVGWYDVPTMEEIEEFTFDSVCLTPAEDDVEPDHPDSWLSLLGLI